MALPRHETLELGTYAPTGLRVLEHGTYKNIR